MSASRYTVIAADDHPVVLSGIRLALRGTGDFTLLAEAEDAETTLAAIEKTLPDLLILDLWMGGNDGIDLLRRIHQEWPSIRVLVYSMNDERSYGARALRAGAVGYLMKSHGLDELLAGLRKIAAGERYMSPILAAELIANGLQTNLDSAKPAELAALSDREIQILRLIGKGQTRVSPVMPSAIQRNFGRWTASFALSSSPPCCRPCSARVAACSVSKPSGSCPPRWPGRPR